MFVDSHAHLDIPDFQPDLGDVLERATEAGVTTSPFARRMNSERLHAKFLLIDCSLRLTAPILRQSPFGASATSRPS